MKVLIDRDATNYRYHTNLPVAELVFPIMYLVSIENPLEPAQCMRFAKCCFLGNG